MTARHALIALSLMALVPGPALAAGPAAPSREVIVLYHEAGQGPEVLRGESIYTATETALNHLGLIARFHDVAEGLPDAALTARARGAIALVEAPVGDSAATARWVAERLDSGRPVAILAGTAFLRETADGTAADSAAYHRVMAAFGAREVAAPVPLVARPGPHGAFEASWPAPVTTTVFEGGRGMEALWRLPDGRALALAGPRGALAVGLDAVREINPLTYRRRWRIDPFWLVDTVFRRPGEPALDTTTLAGRRVFYAHVDGDGFANRAIRQGAPLSAEVVRDEVLKRTPLPTTVSVVAREVAGHARHEAIARSIFALPNVQAASHSYNHPHDWAHGTLTAGGATDGAAEGVRAIATVLDPVREIDESVRYVQTLLPAGRRVEAMLWSGQTNPGEAFLARAAALGIANLNGGDATLDRHRPSVANVAPLARQVGPHLQVYASAANENLFTNLWTGPFDGQLQVLDLFRFAESPRRLAPVNVYYHFYAAERLAGLRALQAIYRWAETQPLCHVTASRYARMVEGFYAGAVREAAPGTWVVTGAGACRTLRFDREPRTPSLAASRGVAGYNRAHGALYVHLAGPDATVVLADRPVAPVPHLEDSSAPVATWISGARAIEATLEAEAPATVRLAGFGGDQAVRVAGSPLRADAAGRLTLTLPAGRRRLEVRW
jgi:hypothetical protein